MLCDGSVVKYRYNTCLMQQVGRYTDKIEILGVLRIALNFHFLELLKFRFFAYYYVDKLLF